MKLDPRIVLPAALAAAALALPSGAVADHDPTQDPLDQCPDHFVLTPVLFTPDPSKDRNGNFFVCHKETPGNGDPTKDDKEVVDDNILPLL